MRKIEHSYTILADLINALFVSFALGFVLFAVVLQTSSSQAVQQLIGLYIVLVAAVVGYVIWRRVSTFKYLKARGQQMMELAAAQNYTYYHHYEAYAAATHDARPLLTTLADINPSQDEKPTATNLLVTPDWTYYDFSYSTYRHTRDGDYKSADVFYGVMDTRLPRPLPNVFFDSKKSRSRHFRFVFQHKQIQHLEGDFDKYFTTYFPQNYEIDSLSFITPDVMQALKAASDYDIEIAGDSLYLYGPIFDLNTQLQDMGQKILAIKKTLAISAADYHDDRLPQIEGGKQVASEGAFLKRSKFWAYVHVGAFVIYIILRIALGAHGSR